MPKLHILHISDTHWAVKNQTDQEIVINALIQDLRSLQQKGTTIDFVVFTGDLVFSGTDPKDFARAHKAIILPILKECKLQPDRFFLCPGNHDIDRQLVVDYIESGLQANLKNMAFANDFFDRLNKGDGTRKSAFDRLKHFNNYRRETVKKPPNVYSSLTLDAAVFECKGEKVGLCLLNSAWRCTGGSDDVDRNKLVVGERNIDEAVRLVSECNIKIAAFHHPVDWLADFDQSAIASRLYSEFDLIMHGHVHKSLPELKFTTSGTALISQAGCLYNSRQYANSYQIIGLDTDVSSCEFLIRTYFDAPRRAFDAAVNVTAEGKFACEFFGRKRANVDPGVRTLLREVGLGIRQREALHLDIGGVLSGSGADARTTFVCPPPATRKHEATAEAELGADQEPEDEYVELETLLRSSDNLLFISSKEGGKTSLANRICVLTSEGLSDKDRVPFVLDYKSLIKSEYHIMEDFETFFKSTPRKLKFRELLREGNLLFVVDDVVLSDEKAQNDLKISIDKYPGCRWIFMAESNSFLGDPGRKISQAFLKRVYVRTLPRRAIREMSRRWCQITGNDDLEANRFVIRQVTDNNLPRTGYMVSLLMWAYQKEKKLERINEAYLLSAIIDHLLGRADFTKALRKEFDPKLAELTLQHFAWHLRENAGTLDANEALVFLVSFFKKKSLPFNAREVLNQLLACGILTEKGANISFKYRCFQEFFVAQHLINEPNLLKSVLSENVLVFEREIYLLSGLRRQNEALIADLVKRLSDSLPTRMEGASPAQFLKIAEQRIYDEATKKKLTAIKTKKMTSEQVDDLLDAAEKEIAQEDAVIDRPNSRSSEESSAPTDHAAGQEEGGSISVFMKELSLLGSVIKNSEFDDGDVKRSAVQFYLEKTSALLVFLVKLMSGIVEAWFVDFIKNNVDTRKMTAEEKVSLKNKILFVMQKIISVIISLRVTEEVASEKLQVVFKEMFDGENASVEDRLFLAFVLYDLNQSDWVGAMKKLIEENEKRPFILDVVTERLWHDLYTRFEPEERRVQISSIVDTIEETTGGSRRRRSSRQAIDRAAYITQVREG